MTRAPRIVAAAWFLAALLPAAAEAQATATCGSRVATSAQFIVRYEEGEWRTTPPVETRITDRDRVIVCIEHFNFLRYTLKFDITEQRSESYSYLTKLWGSIVSPSLGSVLADADPRRLPADPLVERLQQLYGMALDTDAAIANATRPYTATGLTEAQAQTLSAARGSDTSQPKTGIAGRVDVLRRMSRDLQEYLLNPTNARDFARIYGELREMHREVTAFYQAVDERADIFLRLSAKTVGFELKRVGKRQAGTRVTFTVVAVDEAGGVTPVEDVSYFVQSNMPLVLHGGLAFSNLRDVTYDKVTRSTIVGFSDTQMFQEQTNDVFQQRTDEDRSYAYTLFLGWQFFGSGTDVGRDRRQAPFGGAFSLGTDIRQPGKRIFAGPSALIYNRIVVSGGVVFGKEAEGVNETLEPNVFRLIRERPKMKWFFSLSTKVY